MTLPRIGITLGDHGGIGPEIILKVLDSPELPHGNYILYGSLPFITAEAERRRLTAALRRCRIIDVPLTSSLPTGHRPTVESGSASFATLQQGVEAARKGELDALVTAPISKHSWQMAGIPWAGHTDYLEHLFPGAIMAFFSERLNVALYTHHLPLEQALSKIRTEPLENFLLRLYGYAQPLVGKELQLMLAGLNPHAGEGGLLGDEEAEVILPALEAARQHGVPVSGPYPPDIVCRKALDRPECLVVSLYHDQGLVAFKLISFKTGVNVTLGLPFVRTSPDHGTAFDIAGHDQADPGSMLAAVCLAYRFAALGP
jgi:4-hydroxythreonine-4-phosphate dehydrogenase